MKKSLITLLMVSFISSALIGCGEPDTPKVQDKDISIVYTTDVHCAVDTNLGYAKVADYKNKLAETNYVALVDAGDYLQGEFIGAISKGEYVMEIINEMNYDVITLGNHEFDYGMDELKGRLNEFKGDVVSCNLSYVGTKENKLSMVKPYVIKEYGIKKIAYIGITTPTTLTVSNPNTFIEDGKIAYDFGAKTEQDFYNLIQTNIDECKAKGADYVIALSHLGSSDTYKPFRSIDVIKNTTGVDAFLDGHAHADLPWTKEKNKDNKETLLVDTGYKLNEFASLTISKSGEISYDFITSYDSKDEHIDEFVTSVLARAKEQGEEVVSHIDIDLEAEKNYVRTREAPIGDLIADAYRYYGEADIGVVNGGGIRAGLSKGDVTFEDIMNVHPFLNSLIKKKTKGSKIRDYLEFTSMKVTDIPKENQFGAFAQVSGLKYSINTSIQTSVETTTSGEFIRVSGERRVKDIKVLQNDTYVDLVDTQEYTIASHNFLLDNGGDGFALFEEDTSVPTPYLLDTEVLTNYINDVLHGELADKYSKVDKRITILPEGGDDGRIITINKDMLYNAKLYDYRHPDKEYSKDESDKKFTIDVGNGKYIEGAIIFRDCGYQYVGNNLLDAFGIKNTSDTSQAYNFNILFYLDKLTRFDIAYTVYSDVFNNIDQQIKFSKDEKLTEDDFYSSLDNVPYKQIIERAGGNYGDTLFPGGNTAAGNDYYINNYIDDSNTINKSYFWALTEGNSKLVGFNLRNCDDYEDHFIESKGELRFNITSLQFYYQS